VSKGNVVEFTGITKLDLLPERVLAKASEQEFEGVIVIGWKKDGDRYFASSYASGPEVLWLLELSKKNLLEIGDGE